MEVSLLAAVYLLTILIPINGLLFLGIRTERKRIRTLTITLWKLKSRRRR